MEGLGGVLSIDRTTLSGQDNLTRSLWSNIAALDSNADLAGILSTIQLTVGRGAFTSELEKLLNSSVEVGFNLGESSDSRNQLHSDSEMATYSSAEDSRAVFDTSGLFRQPIVPQGAVERDYDSEAGPKDSAQDSLTGITKGATLAGDVDQLTTKTSFQPDASTVSTGETADFNRDGDSDLVWRNLATGKNIVWLMQGGKLSSSTSLPAVTSSNWRMGGTGDFNRDGDSDLVWRNLATGKNIVWLMQGGKLSSSTSLPAVTSSNWRMGGTGDFNRDGDSDLVWRNLATGKNIVWLMQGGKVSSSTSLPAVTGSNWYMGSTSHRVNLSSSFTQINWSTAAPSSIGRSEALGTTVDGKLYLFGGYIDKTYTPTRRSDVYDPTSDTWTRLQDMPKGLTHTGTAVDEVNNDIYLAGGYIEQADGSGQSFGTRKVWKYDVETDTWTTLPLLPQPRASGELSLVNGELHFFGGTNIKRTQDVGDHWVLSLGGTSWTNAAPLPNPRTHMGDAVIGDKIYAIGGQHGHDQNLVTQNSVHEYNPVTNTWRSLASMPKAVSHISSSTFVMDGRIIVAGGETDHGSANTVADVTAYDPLTNSWTALTPLPAARRSGVAASLGNQIFYTTGGPGFRTTTYKGVPAN